MTKNLYEKQPQCLITGSLSRPPTLWINLGRRASSPNEQWEKAAVFIYKCSLSTRIQEVSYKLRTQWYITPTKIKSLSPQESDVCWRCNKSKITFPHIWRTGKKIHTFWDQIKSWITHITNTQLKHDIACCLLHVNIFSYRKYQKSLSRHLLNAAKALIPPLWKTRKTPSFKRLASKSQLYLPDGRNNCH